MNNIIIKNWYNLLLHFFYCYRWSIVAAKGSNQAVIGVPSLNAINIQSDTENLIANESIIQHNVTFYSTMNGNGKEKILSRRRRFLTFPSGSSFQVVYDQTIPIVALPNYFTIGVTVAIAWPLPTEPLYKIHQQILDRYKDIEEKRIAELKQDLIQKRVDSNVANVTHHVEATTKRNYVYKDDPNKIFAGPMKWDRNDWNSLFQKISQIKNSQSHQMPSKPMRYYPSYGKRSIETNYLNHEDMFYAHQHRSTRHELYSKIEKFLEARGLDGASCILRALCETGQRSGDEEPGTFLQEIFRAIFSLPAAILREDKILPKHQDYDDAHSRMEECKEVYRTCNHSIWDPNFVF